MHLLSCKKKKKNTLANIIVAEINLLPSPEKSKGVYFAKKIKIYFEKFTILLSLKRTGIILIIHGSNI